MAHAGALHAQGPVRLFGTASPKARADFIKENSEILVVAKIGKEPAHFSLIVAGPPRA
jgi:hypothetical protein